MSYSFSPTATPAWALNRPPVIPSLPPLNLGASGLGSLPGAAGGILARGLPGAAAAAPRFAPVSTLASQVPRGVGAEALTAANALRGGGQAAARGAGGLLSRLPSMGGLLSGGSVAARPMLGGLGFGVAGAVGSGLIDRLNPGGQNSNLEQGLQGAATGAGIGAGLGLLGGPLAPLTSSAGAAIGGLAGGALGVLGNMFGGGGGDGEEAASPIDILGTAIQSARLTPDQTEEILSTYEVMTALAENAPEGAERDALMAQAYDTAGQMILQAMQQEEATASGQSNMLALQAQAQDIFQPLAQDIRASGEMYANAMRGLSADLPPEYRKIADYQVARELSSSQKLAAAYQAQAAVTPAINQLAQYQQDYNALAAQTWQQAMAQQAAGMGGGQQATDIAALLAPTS